MVTPDSGTAPARRCCSRGLSLEIGILALLLYLAVSYACSRRSRCRRRCRRQRGAGSGAEDQEAGISDAAIAAIVYEQADAQALPMDCAVCLGQVEAGERLRRLPKCAHLFHADCVGAWLRAHSTCPMCRAATTDTTPAAARALPPGVAPGVQARRLPWEA